MSVRILNTSTLQISNVMSVQMSIISRVTDVMRRNAIDVLQLILCLQLMGRLVRPNSMTVKLTYRFNQRICLRMMRRSGGCVRTVFMGSSGLRENQDSARLVQRMFLIVKTVMI